MSKYTIDKLPDGVTLESYIPAADASGVAQKVQVSSLQSLLDSNIKPLPSNDWNEVIEPGKYYVERDKFFDGTYTNTPFIRKQGIYQIRDFVLEVEEGDQGIITQNIYWPSFMETLITRVYTPTRLIPRFAGEKWSYWFSPYGKISVKICIITETGLLSDDSLQDLTTIGMMGEYELMIYGINEAGSTSGVSLTAAQATALGFPDIRKWGTTNYSWSGYITLKITNTASNNGSSMATQTLFCQYGYWGAGSTSLTSIPFEFKRTGKSNNGTEGSVDDWTPWWPSAGNTLRTLSIGSVNPVDTKLAAGSLTIPPLTLTSGVNKQTVAVPGALNYDGTNLYITLADGKTYPITLGTALT